MIGPPSVRYNVGMFNEEDDIPTINEQQPSECEDQFDDDLMHDLTKQLDRKSKPRASPTQ